MSNRTLLIIGCALLTLLLLRQEVRMDMLEEKLDDIIQVKGTGEQLVAYMKREAK